MSVVYINNDGNIVDKPIYSYSLDEKRGIKALVDILTEKNEDEYADKINNAIEQDTHPSFLVSYIEGMNLFDPCNFLWTAFKINRKPIAYKYKSVTLSELDTGLIHIEEKHLVKHTPITIIDWPIFFPDWVITTS